MAEPDKARTPPLSEGDGSVADGLESLRARIDEVDVALLELMNQRAELVQDVGRLKQASRTGVYEPSRERRIVEGLRERNRGPFPSDALAPVFREIISATRSLEESLQVAFLGPAGTFSHQAALAQFGAMARLEAVSSIVAVFDAVESGRVGLGIVPVENSTEGVVTQTLDTLAEHEVSVCAERVLPVSLTLLSQSGRLEDVERITSHPQPLAQSRRWLDEHLPGVERVEAASTAAAAQIAARDPGAAAIGAPVAAEVYELAVIAESIEDRHDNRTRFLVIGGDPPAPSQNDLTSLLFTTRRDESGALLRLLEPFSREGVNLTSIQLRPIQGKPWEYLFFIDCEGHLSDPGVARAIDAARRIAHSTRVLGSFPRAELRGARSGETR